MYGYGNLPTQRNKKIIAIATTPDHIFSNILIMITTLPFLEFGIFESKTTTFRLA
jgi:Sec-independent protein secretion pathway component TatC